MSITIDGNKDPYDILNKFDFRSIDMGYKEGRGILDVSIIRRTDYRTAGL